MISKPEHRRAEWGTGSIRLVVAIVPADLVELPVSRAFMRWTGATPWKFRYRGSLQLALAYTEDRCMFAEKIFVI